MTSPRSDPRSFLTAGQAELYNAVEKHVSTLQRWALDEQARHPDVAARLARLRRAVAVSPGSAPDVWADTIAIVPESLSGTSEVPTVAERAGHTAITLFAVHTQGGRGAAHRRGQSLGRAVRLCVAARSADGDPTDSPVFKRFQALATASSPAELNHHLRSMVTLLRAESIALDYGLLAVDIHSLASVEGAKRVRLRWGRDFHRSPIDTDESDSTKTAETQGE